MEFGDFIESERALLDRMAAMSPADVEASWAQTKASLHVEEDEEDEEGCDECATYPCSCGEEAEIG
jgi:hypothetical protein